MSTVFKKPVIGTIGNLLDNLGKLLKIAWKTDKFLTVGYYGSAGISALFPIIASYIYRLFIDNIIANQGISPTIPLVLVAILGARYVSSLVWDFFAWVLKETFFDYLLRYKLQNHLNNVFSEKLSRMDVASLENPKTQDLITKTRDTLTWRPPDFLRAFSYVFNNVVSFVSAFLLLVPYGALLPFAITLFGIPRLFLRASLGRLQWSIWGSGAPEVKKLWYLQWVLTNKNTIIESRIFQSSKSLLARYKKTQQYLFDKNKGPVYKFIRVASFPQMAEMVLLFGVAYYKLPLVLSGEMSVGEFSFFIELLSRLADSVGGMVGNLGWMYENNLYVNHLFEVLGVKNKIVDKEKPTPIPKKPFPPRIEFRGVSFAYPGSKRKVLRDISFVVEPGQNIAIVGKNGAGKSTIVKLLCRFYDVTSGEILLNGVNIKDVARADWYGYLGTLFQDFVHYNFSVRDNILFGNIDKKDDKALYEAARRSGALEFIEKLPRGFDTQLGKEYEDGMELSQGQWQKLAITRAFYEGAPILILDEPTSAIDAEAEYEIFQNLDKYYQDKSLVLISHRFSTVRNADRILVVDKGRILEAGSHEELLKNAGIYAKMFKTQAIGYK